MEMTATKMEKGTGNVKLQVVVGGVPETAEELLTIIEENPTVARRVILQVHEATRQEALARAAGQERAEGTYDTEVDFIALLAEPRKKLTAKAMVEKLAQKKLEIADKIMEVASAGDVEKLQELSAQAQENEELLQQWIATREAQRANRK